jgi:DNA repair exonuclease SbcCD ATPase subunit
MTTAQQTLDARKKELDRKRAENDLLNRQITTAENRILELVASLELAKEALGFLTDLADGRRGAMKGKIESVVTEALRLIYGGSYRVELSYAVKNNRSNLEIEMVRDTQTGEVRRDMNGFGGGVADTISVPLRLMVLVGSRRTDKVCILDECWKHIDVGRIELVGKFLRALSEQLGMQVIFATHHLPLQQFADRVYQMSEKDGKSEVKVV